MMRVLFVGASGVIGSQTVPLLAEKFDIHPVALQSGTVGKLNVAACDITDFLQVMAAMQDVDAVVNCAIESPRRENGQWFDQNNRDELHAYNEGGIEVNVRGAYYLYEAAARCGVKRFVFISSMTAVLGPPAYEYIARDAAPQPRDFYACTKIFGENLGRLYAHDTNRPMRVLALRLGQPYPSLIDYDEHWHETARSRGLMVAVQDVAQAIECALHCETSFGIYPILSASDAPWVDTSRNVELGYTPRYRFTQSGIASNNDD
jgi:uronate dehydrogenase